MKPPDSKHSRYVLDALYGVVRFPDYVWEILFTPEIQRLRELRLYNINSLYFTGGANINRYEHSLGTCYLALQCIEAKLNSIPQKEKMLIAIAALLHDLYNAAFGHSLEYVEKFSPADLFIYKATDKNYIHFKHKHVEFEPIYFGMCEEIPAKLKFALGLSELDINKIGNYIKGNGEYGALISGTIDLDNIDNIYRMSYHMGLTQDSHTPLLLARSMWCKKEELYFAKSAIPLVKNWISLRERLYKYLLLNPDEFSAKYMLTEAIELSQENNIKPYLWYETDFQLLEKLFTCSPDISNIISRLMKGTLYGCFGIYKTTNIEIFKLFDCKARRSELESGLSDLLVPNIKVRTKGLTKKEQQAIKGIKGIYYDAETLYLRLSCDIKKKTIEKLTSRELRRHRIHIIRMYTQMQDKLSKFGLRQANLGIHIISDIDKTHRKVSFRLQNDDRITIGQSSRCLYIAVFIKNAAYANFNTTIKTEIRRGQARNVRIAIKNYLADHLQASDLTEIDLYAEAEND